MDYGKSLPENSERQRQQRKLMALKVTHLLTYIFFSICNELRHEVCFQGYHTFMFYILQGIVVSESFVERIDTYLMIYEDTDSPVF